MTQLFGLPIPFTTTADADSKFDFDAQKTNALGTYGANKLEQLSNRGGVMGFIGSRSVGILGKATLELGDAALNITAAVIKTVVGVVFGALELTAAVVGKSVNLAEKTGLKHYTLKQAAGHLGRTVGGGFIAVTTLVVGVVSPTKSVAISRALGFAKVPQKPSQSLVQAKAVANHLNKNKIAYGGTLLALAAVFGADKYFETNYSGKSFTAVKDFTGDWASWGADQAVNNTASCKVRGWIGSIPFVGQYMPDCEGSAGAGSAV